MNYEDENGKTHAEFGYMKAQGRCYYVGLVTGWTGWGGWGGEVGAMLKISWVVEWMIWMGRNVVRSKFSR